MTCSANYQSDGFIIQCCFIAQMLCVHSFHIESLLNSYSRIKRETNELSICHPVRVYSNVESSSDHWMRNVWVHIETHCLHLQPNPPIMHCSVCDQISDVMLSLTRNTLALERLVTNSNSATYICQRDRSLSVKSSFSSNQLLYWRGCVAYAVHERADQ